MKILLSVALISLVLLPSFAVAQPGNDGIGVYFDVNGWSYEYQTSVPFEPVNAYLLATNITDPSGISGWECAVNMTGIPAAPQWNVSAGLNVANGAEGLFNVGIGLTPLALPAAPAVLLATWSGFIMNPSDIVEFLVVPYPGSVSFDDTPGYASGSDAGHLIPLNIDGGCFQSGWSIINMYCPLANEDRSWGDIKTLYR